MTHHEMMLMISRKASEISSQPRSLDSDFERVMNSDEQFLSPEPYRAIGDEAISDDMFVTAQEWRGE